MGGETCLAPEEQKFFASFFQKRSAYLSFRHLPGVGFRNTLRRKTEMMDGGADSRRITIHKPEDFAPMRAAGRLAAETLDMIGAHVVPGVTTDHLNNLVHEFTLAHGAVSAQLNYRGFPKSVCISINHVVCHGIPGDKKLLDGDVLNIDVTVILNGWYGDSSRMYVAGTPSTRAKRLIEATYEALMRGIAAVKPGATFGDVGHVIQTYVESQRFSVVRDFCGHGIGRRFHEAPNVLHFGRPGEGAVFKPGMFFTIEPMVNAGRPEVKILEDGWTAVTRDRSLSAQFEHMVGVTETGCEIFTLSPAGYTVPPYG
jgi:methionyl aminopeptidase